MVFSDDDKEFIAEIPPELVGLLQVQTGKAILRSNDLEQPKETREIVRLILQLDYNEAERCDSHLRTEERKEPFKVTYANLHISPYNEKYWVNFTRISSNSFWQCWYQFNPDSRNFSNVYGVRLTHTIFGRDKDETIQRIGDFIDILDEKPKTRLRRLFKEGGANKLLEFILHNKSGDSHWEGQDPRILLAQEKITIEDYLGNAAYILNPYTVETPQIIKNLRLQGYKKFIEVWQSDVTFGGHLGK